MPFRGSFMRLFCAALLPVVLGTTTGPPVATIAPMAVSFESATLRPCDEVGGTSDIGGCWDVKIQATFTTGAFGSDETNHITTVELQGLEPPPAPSKSGDVYTWIIPEDLLSEGAAEYSKSLDFVFTETFTFTADMTQADTFTESVSVKLENQPLGAVSSAGDASADDIVGFANARLYTVGTDSFIALDFNYNVDSSVDVEMDLTSAALEAYCPSVPPGPSTEIASTCDDADFAIDNICQTTKLDQGTTGSLYFPVTDLPAPYVFDLLFTTNDGGNKGLQRIVLSVAPSVTGSIELCPDGIVATVNVLDGVDCTFYSGIGANPPFVNVALDNDGNMVTISGGSVKSESLITMAVRTDRNESFTVNLIDVYVVYDWDSEANAGVSASDTLTEISEEFTLTFKDLTAAPFSCAASAPGALVAEGDCSFYHSNGPTLDREHVRQLETDCEGQCTHDNDGHCVPLSTCPWGPEFDCVNGIDAENKNIACPAGNCYCPAGSSWEHSFSDKAWLKDNYLSLTPSHESDAIIDDFFDTITDNAVDTWFINPFVGGLAKEVFVHALFEIVPTGDISGRRRLLQASSSLPSADGAVAATVRYDVTAADFTAAALGVAREFITTWAFRMTVSADDACLAQQSLRDTLRARILAALDSASRGVTDVQITSVEVDLQGVDCAAGARRLLAAADAVPTVTVESLLIMDDTEGAENFVDVGTLLSAPGMLSAAHAAEEPAFLPGELPSLADSAAQTPEGDGGAEGGDASFPLVAVGSAGGAALVSIAAVVYARRKATQLQREERAKERLDVVLACGNAVDVKATVCDLTFDIGDSFPAASRLTSASPGLGSVVEAQIVGAYADESKGDPAEAKAKALRIDEVLAQVRQSVDADLPSGTPDRRVEEDEASRVTLPVVSRAESFITAGSFRSLGGFSGVSRSPSDLPRPSSDVAAYLGFDTEQGFQAATRTPSRLLDDDGAPPVATLDSSKKISPYRQLTTPPPYLPRPGSLARP